MTAFLLAAVATTNAWPFITIRHADALRAPEKLAETIRMAARQAAVEAAGVRWKIYDRFVAEGWTNIAWLERENLFGTDGEGTVDGVHPNDLGMMSMAKAFESALKEFIR